MKTIAKGLSALLIVLTMMVFAFPASAAMTFAVRNVTPAAPTIYDGETPTGPTFTFDITDASGAATDEYSISVTDPTEGAAFGANQILTEPAGTITGVTRTAQTVSVTIRDITAEQKAAGTHNLLVKVDKTSGNGRGDQTIRVPVGFSVMPAAVLTGNIAGGAVAVRVGQAINLNVVGVEPANGENVSLQWQITKTAGKPTTSANPDDTAQWENMSGQTGTTLGAALTDAMIGKYVRCVVTVNGKKIVAAYTENDTAKHDVRLDASDAASITLTTANKDTTYYAGHEDSKNDIVLTVQASGGTKDPTKGYSYQWMKNGKALIGPGAAGSSASGTITYTIKPKDEAFTGADAGEYNCVVFDQNGLEATLASPIRITVDTPPTLKIKEAAGQAVTYTNPPAADQQHFLLQGSINIPEADFGKPLTLTAETTGLSPTGYTWYRPGSGPEGWEPIEGANAATYTIPKEDLTIGQSYMVKVTFGKTGMLNDPLTYIAVIREKGGSLDGDTLISEDGGVTFTKNPIYTITLSEGKNFINADMLRSARTIRELANAGVVIQPANVMFYATSITDVTVTTYDPDTHTPAALSFRHGTLINTDGGETRLTQPVFSPMVVYVEREEGGFMLGITGSGAGYNITLPLEDHQVVFDTPQDVKSLSVPYTGKPVEATAKATVVGAGKLSNYRFASYTGDVVPDIKTATAKAPTNAGKYYVWCDVAAGEKYSERKDASVGVLTIDQVNLTQDGMTDKQRSAFFAINPQSAVYNGKNQKPDVRFADGVTLAGEIKDVKFYDAAFYPQRKIEVDPRNIGHYKVAVKTGPITGRTDSDANVKATDDYVVVGDFHITKTEPTAALYKMEPVKAEYTGAEQAPVITPAKSAGDVDAVHYVKDGSVTELEGKPVDVGTYTVTIDTAESDDYAAVKGLEIGTFEITKGKPTKDLYTMAPTEAAYTGKAQKPTITPAEGAGEADRVHYYLNGKEISGDPMEPGIYTVKIDTKETNTYAAAKALELGSFTIKGGAAKQAVAYRAHVQNIGWQPYLTDGTMAGTSGLGYRLEAININLQNQKYTGDIEYRTHIENIGWESDWKKNDAMSGTSKRALRLEAMQVRLTGEMAENYDVYYRVHAQNFGWLGWAKNGETSGTSGFGYRLEAMQIMLVDKGGAEPEVAPDSVTNKASVEKYKDDVSANCLVAYQTHVENVGWQNYTMDGGVAGTSGLAYRLEGMKIYLNNPRFKGDIEYCTHIQNIGWEKQWKKNDDMSGTSEKSLRLEAMRVRLTGEMAENYDVYYRVHAQNFGWLGWAKNGEASGTAGFGYRLEAMQIMLVDKGGAAPSITPDSTMVQPFVETY